MAIECAPHPGGRRQKATGWSRQLFPGAAHSESLLTGRGLTLWGDCVCLPPCYRNGGKTAFPSCDMGSSGKDLLTLWKDFLEIAPALKQRHTHIPLVIAGSSPFLSLSHSSGRFLAQVLVAISLPLLLKRISPKPHCT